MAKRKSKLKNQESSKRKPVSKKSNSVRSKSVRSKSNLSKALSEPVRDETWSWIKEMFQLKIKKTLTFRGAISLILKFIIIIGIAVWLSPQIDFIPSPYNWIGFVLLVIVFVFVEFVWREKKKKQKN